nr:hypothetical protein [Tanacetum cinerariifolium]
RSTAAPRGVKANGGVDGVPDLSTIIAQQLHNLLPTLLAQGDVRDVIVNNDRRGCTYKEFLTCNPKEYDGKGGEIAYTCWIEKMESVQDMSGCGDNQKVKYTARSFVGKARSTHEAKRAGHVAYTYRFHELERLVPYLVTPENKRIERYIYGLALQIRRMVATTEPTTIQKVMQKAGTLIDEAIRNGSLKKNIEKRGNDGEPSKDKNVKDDNKRTRTGNAFATTTNLVRREYTGTTPKGTNCNLYHSSESPCRACFSCNCLGHLVKDCRVVPRIMNPMNARNPITARGACFECSGTYHFKAACPRLNQVQRPGGGHPNQIVAIDGGQGHGKNNNRACGGAFMLGAEEALQDPNIMSDESKTVEQEMSTDTDDDDDESLAPNLQHKDTDLDEWIKTKIGKRMCGRDKENEEDSLIDILKTMVGECKSVYTNKNIQFEVPSCGTNKDLGASVNIIPKSIFEYLKLASLEETSMIVEMADMTERPREPNETMILGRLFLATVHAQIDVLKREISLGIGEDRVNLDMDGGSNGIKVQGLVVEKVASRWHVCKPVRVFYDNKCGEDYGMWPTCNPDLGFCSGYDAIYGKRENGMLEQWMYFQDHERQSV